jgi:hypothetical protein
MYPRPRAIVWRNYKLYGMKRLNGYKKKKKKNKKKRKKKLDYYTKQASFSFNNTCKIKKKIPQLSQSNMFNLSFTKLRNN